MSNCVYILMSMVICHGLGAPSSLNEGAGLAGQDLHVAAPEMTVSTDSDENQGQLMLLKKGVTIQVGDNTLSSRDAVIWVRPHGIPDQSNGNQGRSYLVRVYLEGDVSVLKGSKAKTTLFEHMIVQGAEALVADVVVTGQVFASVGQQRQMTAEILKEDPLFDRAMLAVIQVPSGPVIPDTARVPNPEAVIARPADPFKADSSEASGEIARQLKQAQQLDLPADSDVSDITIYPVQFSAMWKPVPLIEKKLLPDGQEVVVASGRFYLWQQRDDGQILEFMADSMVLFIDKKAFELNPSDYSGSQLGGGRIHSAFLAGNIVMTEGQRTIRADELYYDFANNRALVVNSSLRVFDEQRGIPVYLRAERLGRVSKDIFEARNIQLTSSEFYFPQVSVTASKMVLLTGDALEHYYKLSETADTAGAYEGRMYDVQAKVGDFAFFSWPKMVTNFARPDIPIRRINFGNDSSFGTSLQTSWQLSRLLGMQDPEWIDSQLNLDYYTKRGIGAGVDADYERDDMKGSLISYIMTDNGNDDLGWTRRNVNSDEDVRGRFSFRHRQYLPDDWQLTMEMGYLTDENFLEAMYRNEFYTDKGQETLLYLKRLKDNWMFSVLGKTQINDWESTREELPSVEYHIKGQSFWDNRLTWYSDSQMARFRDRSATTADSGFYTFGFTRNEVDLPLLLGTFKLVPFVAGSYGYEDNMGFNDALSDTSTGSLTPEDQVFLGEAGLRASTMFWKQDPYYRSELWDLQGMRHIITPYTEIIMYEPSDDAVDMRDVVHVGVSQRWQTHRGDEENRRTLDWMRLDIEGTWLSDDAANVVSPDVAVTDSVLINEQLYGPAAFVYNDPSIPFLLRRDHGYFGQSRDTLNVEYAWRLTDTFTLLSDLNYDLKAGAFQQVDLGVSRYVYPDMSYYLGMRCLQPVVINVDQNNNGSLGDPVDFQEQGSSSFVAAVTYRLSPRYIATFSQEYNFDYGESVRSDLAIIRQYHRMFYAMSFSVDDSLDRTSIMLSVWPQGVDELAIGSRRYAGLTGSRWED